MQIELFELATTPNTKSPLGYPGGKRRLWKHLEPYLPHDLTHLISPFMGGGSIELKCTGKNIQVKGYDNFEPLTNFWKYFIRNSRDLIDQVISIYPLTFEQRLYFHKSQLKKGSADMEGLVLSDFERAAIYFCINKQSFRSWGLAAKPSKVEAKYSPNYFTKLRSWKNQNIEVGNSDYAPIIENANGTFLYCDPPYVEKEHYYGSRETKQTFDHENLSELLHKTDSKWILSYGSHPLIRELYKDYTILEPKWNYTVRRNDDPTSQEFLILNL